VVKQYPYANQYRVWPGPNSNTFTAYIIHHVPKLQFAMPYNAVGYDYGWRFKVNTMQLGGVLGYHLTTKAWVFNILGLAFGLSFKPLGCIVPGLGYISVLWVDVVHAGCDRALFQMIMTPAVKDQKNP
jgi:hypothetical protein